LVEFPGVGVHLPVEKPVFLHELLAVGDLEMPRSDTVSDIQQGNKWDGSNSCPLYFTTLRIRMTAGLTPSCVR